MKKIILRLFCLLLCLGMLSCSFLSCRKEEANDEQTSTSEEVKTEESSEEPTETKKTEAELPEVNYGGYDFQILVRPAEACKNDITVAEYTSGAVEKEVYTRTQYLKDTFGVNLVLNESSNANSETDAMKPIQSGECSYDLIACHGRSAGAYAVNNTAYD